ncbi:sugar phosphate isomerase/epimerase [Arthrobacter sp. zg-Y916]|uniref:sugar phosphate isomerase/epimerase family protein n=1 Tax=Arthrobacter sp. zg-Y916 TaxID=2894190 RepID=UPI001E50111A|nr:sugar phosphate isomerase/epimerase [Arthrobacter sp. zg-Y916]MCC9192343.1 sugar phosphate isomerase/epimerase [Arthrobacter sp. zg-Y916]
MTTHTPKIGLAQLSLLRTEPPRLVRIAAAAGFDFVGARVRQVTAAERAYDLAPGSPMFRETMLAVEETGVGIRDIEFLLLDGSDQRSAWLQMMEAGEALRAATLTVAASLTDHGQLAGILAQMVKDGADFGIVPTLEVISYQSVNSLPLAAELARDSGCRIVADTLHLSRVGTTDAELQTYGGLVPLLQLCDGPVDAPADRDGLVLESRSERQVPGEGGFRLAEMIAALPEGTPVSVETPSDSALARLGEQAWANRLKQAADSVIASAGRLRASARAFPEPPPLSGCSEHPELHTHGTNGITDEHHS